MKKLIFICSVFLFSCTTVKLPEKTKATLCSDFQVLYENQINDYTKQYTSGKITLEDYTALVVGLTAIKNKFDVNCEKK